MGAENFQRELADGLFQTRRLRSVPIRFHAIGCPYSGVLGSYVADQTMQLRGASISALSLGAPDQYLWSVSVANNNSITSLGQSGNTESVWLEQMGSSGHGAPPQFAPFGSDYDGFYLNKGETVYILGTNQFTFNGNFVGSGHLIGTVMLYYLPTYRQV